MNQQSREVLTTLDSWSRAVGMEPLLRVGFQRGAAIISHGVKESVEMQAF